MYSGECLGAMHIEFILEKTFQCLELEVYLQSKDIAFINMRSEIASKLVILVLRYIKHGEGSYPQLLVNY